MDQFWQRVAIAGVVIIVTLIAARIVDRVIGRRLEARAETWTRYQVLRRSAVVTVLAVGTLSALLVIPGVRAVAGTVLASSAVIALIIGFAAQTTLSNFVAGLFLAVTQPIRLGDRVEIGTAAGVVENGGTSDGGHGEHPFHVTRADGNRGTRSGPPRTGQAKSEIRKL